MKPLIYFGKPQGKLGGNNSLLVMDAGSSHFGEVS